MVRVLSEMDCSDIMRLVGAMPLMFPSHSAPVCLVVFDPYCVP